MAANRKPACPEVRRFAEPTWTAVVGPRVCRVTRTDVPERRDQPPPICVEAYDDHWWPLSRQGETTSPVALVNLSDNSQRPLRTPERMLMKARGTVCTARVKIGREMAPIWTYSVQRPSVTRCNEFGPQQVSPWNPSFRFCSCPEPYTVDLAMNEARTT